MGVCVASVCRKVNFDYIVFCKMQVILCRRTGNGAWVEDHDSLVGSSNAKFVFGTDHSVALDAADLALLHLHLLTALANDCSDGSQKDLLPRCYVRRTANHLKRLSGTDIDLGHMKVVAVRMHLTLDHFPYDDSGQSAGNLLLTLAAIYLQADGVKRILKLFNAQIR